MLPHQPHFTHCFMYTRHTSTLFSFFFNDTATPEIYTLSLHDALPIFGWMLARPSPSGIRRGSIARGGGAGMSGSPLYQRPVDRKSTRLNSSHVSISYAVFCLKKKIKQTTPMIANVLEDVNTTMRTISP